MGHKGNRCQTEYSAATWRTTWPWRRSAGSDCFLVHQAIYTQKERKIKHRKGEKRGRDKERIEGETESAKSLKGGGWT